MTALTKRIQSRILNSSKGSQVTLTNNGFAAKYSHQSRCKTFLLHYHQRMETHQQMKLKTIIHRQVASTTLRLPYMQKVMNGITLLTF